MKKILTTLLILTLTVSMNAFCSFAYADTALQGEGTEENPYLLYTRAELFCVNNDVNASYKLMGESRNSPQSVMRRQVHSQALSMETDTPSATLK